MQYLPDKIFLRKFFVIFHPLIFNDSVPWAQHLPCHWLSLLKAAGIGTKEWICLKRETSLISSESCTKNKNLEGSLVFVHLANSSISLRSYKLFSHGFFARFPVPGMSFLLCPIRKQLVTPITFDWTSVDGASLRIIMGF